MAPGQPTLTFANGASALRLAYESTGGSYGWDGRRWTEVQAHADGSFSVTKGWEEVRRGERDYDWDTERYATRGEAFAAAGIADPQSEVRRMLSEAVADLTGAVA